MMRRVGLALAVLSLFALTAAASTISDPLAAGFTPRVPVSSLGMLGNWFDASRLHMSTTMTVGSGWGGGSTSALNVTSLSYQFRAPISMSVSVGNAIGSNATTRGSAMFLEGLNLTYQPSRNTFFQIQYRDIRTPLQYGAYGIAGPRGFSGY